MTAETALKDADHKMKRALEVAHEEFSTVRTGRATPAVLNRVTVDYYGTQTPMNQLASFSVPEPRTLVIQPFDKNAMGAMEKAIMQSELGLTPSNDGNVIRLSFPPLTEERRKELIKVVKHEAENARVAIRNLRRDANNHLKDALKKHEVSENEERSAQNEVQKMTDRHIGEIDKLLAEKEKELLAV